MNSTGRRLTTLGGLLAVLLFSPGFVYAQAFQERSPIFRHVPDIVASGQAVVTRAVDESRYLPLVLSLPLRHEAELDSLIEQLYDPRSSKYHRYLSADEFTAQFAPAQEDYDAVVRWAQSKGFTVTRTTPNRRLVDVSGSVATINRAFGIKMSSYRHPDGNRLFFAPDREPALDLDVPLLAIGGLTDVNLPHSHYRKGTAVLDSNRATQAAHAVANISGSGPGNTYLPSDMRAAYYGAGTLTGQGQTVAVFSFNGYLQSDLQLYYSSTGMSSNVPVKPVLVNGYSGQCWGSSPDDLNTCDDGEQILDIVNVIGMAPGLKQVLFYEGLSATDVLNQMATDNVAEVISSSWGGGDFGPASVSAFKQFKAQGQTYLNATGDRGYFHDSWTYDAPSVDPNITQVGGTDLITNGPGGSWASETAWSDSGGGYVDGTPIPSYQQLAGVINSSNKGSATLRNSPDVAAEADFDNTTVINGSFSSGYGGTSYATPRWAGLIALANQQSIANGNGTVGFLNPKLYSIGVSSSFASGFHDIASGNNGGFNAVAGYDLVTGWGTPQGAALIAMLAGTAQASPATLTFTSSNATKSAVNENAVVRAKLTVTSSGAAIGGKSVVFKLGSGTGSESCHGTTDSTGVAACVITPGEAPGVYTLTATFTADSSFAGSSASTSFTITPAFVMDPVSLSAATVGKTYSAMFTASGGTGNFTWSATNVPAGLIFTSNSGPGGQGKLSGTPQTAAGSPFTISVTVTDGLSTISKSYALTVNSSGVQAVSVNPKSGNGLGPQTFTALYTDSSGYKDLQTVYLDFGSPAADCKVAWQQSGNALFLYNDTGQISGPIVPGSPGSQQSNSQCTVFGSGSGLNAAGTSGNNLTVTFNITFKAAFAGVKNIYGYAQSYSGANSAWQTLGSWTVPGQSLGVVSVTPNSGSGAGPQTFTVTATDPNGAADLSVVFLEFATSAGADQSCFAVYVPAGNKLYLYSDDNKSLIGPAGGSNHQCTLSSGGTATPSGNNLTVPFTVKFSPGFTGPKNIFAYAQSSSGGSGGWQLFGSWTPQ